MKVTTSAGPVSSSRLTVAPVAGSGSANGGAGVPRASMVDSVAMPARVGPRRLRRACMIAECGCGWCGGAAGVIISHRNLLVDLVIRDYRSPAVLDSAVFAGARVDRSAPEVPTRPRGFQES